MHVYNHEGLQLIWYLFTSYVYIATCICLKQNASETMYAYLVKSQV